MNYNFTVVCDTCEEKTNLRVGMSNRDVQPLRFSCPCGAPIDITIGGSEGGLVGATAIEGFSPFDDETNFVDLHLDFPVMFGKYEMGKTPYMQAFSRIGHREMMIHNGRLNFLNANYELLGKFNTVLKLFKNGKAKPFKLNVDRTFGVEVRSEKPEDILLALFDLLAKMMAPFALPEQIDTKNDVFMATLRTISEKHTVATDALVNEVIDNKFLSNLLNDALEIYPRIWKAELPMRPALFLDWDDHYAVNPIAMRVSTEQFESFKDLFKDISEIISRQLVIVAAINNIIKRGDHDAFAPKVTNAGNNIGPTSLNAYADIELGRKHEFIDDPWYEMIEGPIDNQLRNAIAHYKAEYDDVTQTVTYYPRKEGMEQEKSKETNFLEFMRLLLVAYRDMHHLNRLVRSLLYYKYLILEKKAA